MGNGWDGEPLPFSEDFWREVRRVLRPGGYMLAFGGTRTYHRMASAIEDAGFVVRDTVMWIHGQGFPKSKSCLKPAFEPIILAWNPAPKVTPLNIDGCRVGYDGKSMEEVHREAGSPTRHGDDSTRTKYNGGWSSRPDPIAFHPSGRWPSNLTHDGSPEVMEAFAAFGVAGGGDRRGQCGGKRPGGFVNTGATNGDGEPNGTVYADSGSAARFFYCSKASRADRGDGNTHPTVKSTELMRWLCRLVTPPGGAVLDPFAGSGSTLLAADAEGFDSVGIERSAEYVGIIRDRIAAARHATPLLNGASA